MKKVCKKSAKTVALTGAGALVGRRRQNQNINGAMRGILLNKTSPRRLSAARRGCSFMRQGERMANISKWRRVVRQRSNRNATKSAYKGVSHLVCARNPWSGKSHGGVCEVFQHHTKTRFMILDNKEIMQYNKK